MTRFGGLTVRNLSARYGTHAIVHDISLSIAPGECVAVVGESGSGKTTLSRCIIGMHRDFSGEVLWNDVELAPKARKRSSSVLRDVQYIFQNPFSALNPRRTVRDNLMQWADVLVGGTAAVKNDLVMDSLNQVGLSADYLSRFPDELSGGQQQRVAIARALVSQPKLIICDEITAALDVSVQASVMELLGRLQRERGLGVLFVTHNLPLVRSIAHRVLVMQAGRIVEEGEVAQIFAQPRADYTRELIGNTPSLRDHLSEGTIFDRDTGSAT